MPACATCCPWAYLALFGSVVAFWAYVTLIGRIGPDRAAYTSLLFPVVALLISTVVEGLCLDLDFVPGILPGIAG